MGDSHIPWLRAGGFGADGEYLAWLEADLKVGSTIALYVRTVLENVMYVPLRTYRPRVRHVPHYRKVQSRHACDAYYRCYAHHHSQYW